VARAGQVITNRLSGERIVIRRTAADTGGELLLFDLFLPPGARVPAAHAHPEQQERFTVVAGHVRFRIGLRAVIAGPGETVTVPPNASHAFANAGRGPAEVQVEVRPALRLEELFESTEAMSAPGRAVLGRLPRPSDLIQLLHEFRHEVRMPYLPSSLASALIGAVAGLTSGLARRGGTQ
jgi:quercetin dioxygenase-like cupin family protein